MTSIPIKKGMYIDAIAVLILIKDPSGNGRVTSTLLVLVHILFEM